MTDKSLMHVTTKRYEPHESRTVIIRCYGSCPAKTPHLVREVYLDGVLFFESRCNQCGFERITNPTTGEMLVECDEAEHGHP